MIWIMIVLAMFVLAVGALMFVVIRDIRRTRKKYDGEWLEESRRAKPQRMISAEAKEAIFNNPIT